MIPRSLRWFTAFIHSFQFDSRIRKKRCRLFVGSLRNTDEGEACGKTPRTPRTRTTTTSSTTKSISREEWNIRDAQRKPFLPLALFRSSFYFEEGDFPPFSRERTSQAAKMSLATFNPFLLFPQRKQRSMSCDIGTQTSSSSSSSRPFLDENGRRRARNPLLTAQPHHQQRHPQQLIMAASAAEIAVNRGRMRSRRKIRNTDGDFYASSSFWHFSSFETLEEKLKSFFFFF